MCRELLESKEFEVVKFLRKDERRGLVEDTSIEFDLCIKLDRGIFEAANALQAALNIPMAITPSRSEQSPELDSFTRAGLRILL